MFARNLDNGSIPNYGSGKYFVLIHTDIENLTTEIEHIQSHSNIAIPSR